MTKKEDTTMKSPNTSVVQSWCVHVKNAVLAALHVLVLTVSLAIHSPIENGADRVLP
jgi:hypothetical protein